MMIMPMNRLVKMKWPRKMKITVNHWLYGRLFRSFWISVHPSTWNGPWRTSPISCNISGGACPPVHYWRYLIAGKTRAHCGGNIANVVMFPKCWLVLPRTQHCGGHKCPVLDTKNVSPRAARNNVAAFCYGRATSYDTILLSQCVLVLPGP